MRHLLQLLLQHFYSFRNGLSSSRQGKWEGMLCPALNISPDPKPVSDPHPVDISDRSAEQSSAINDPSTRALLQQPGKMLGKTAVISQRHSENSRAVISPAPFIREVSKAARENHSKEFFLKHRKSPMRYHQMGKQLWNIPAVVQQGAIPPQPIPWGFP